MILIYCVIFALYLCYVLQNNNESHYLFLSLGISMVYYGQQHLHEQIKSFNKILRGQFPTHLLFISWLYFYKPRYFLNYIPLLLSNAGKIYWMFKQKNRELSTSNQQMVVFQCQCQAFIGFTLIFSGLSFIPGKILQFLTYVLILKLKYRFYGPAHKAYNELHFFFDRLSRNLKFRSFYHLLYKIISSLSNDAYPPSLNWQILY